MEKSEIRFRKEIYCFREIMEAIDAYREIADINLMEEADYYICRFTGCKAEEQLVKNEFANYVLGLTVKGAAG